MELGREKTVGEIVSRIRTARPGAGAVRVEGTWGSFAHLLTAHISKQIDRPILHICPHIDDADKAADDMQTFGAKLIEPFGAWEGEEEIADATDEIRAARLGIAMKVLAGKQNLLIPTSVQALCQPVPKAKALEKTRLRLKANENLPPETVIDWLVDNSFERVDRIDLPGQFARRGGIIDIFAPLADEKILTTKKTPTGSSLAEAIRIEYFGDTIESIRQINLDTQRSSNQLKSITIVSAVAGIEQKDRELFLNILPKNTIVILEEPTDIQEVAQVYLSRVENPDRLYKWNQIHKAMAGFTQLHICRFATAGEDFLKIDIRSIQQYQRKAASLWASHKEALADLTEQAKKDKKVILYCESPAEISRITEIIKQTNQQIPKNFKLLHGFIHQGFTINSLNTIVISHHELFGQYAMVRRKQRTMRSGAAVDTLSDLNPGDFVVHLSYGIGKYLGIETIEEKGSKSEYLTIGFANSVKIHVAVSNIALIQKYIGTSPKRPTLSKIGTKRWLRQKEKVINSVQDLASELLEVQAKRSDTNGIAYPDDSNWQIEFEEAFPYQETPDQLTSAEQIKADMQIPVAMDRLLCGDVGYGKTELAMRAAFKAVESGRQVAVLTPTTVLCVQHGRTFTERFADFPIVIEVINRFKSTAQAKDIVARARAGKVDILIGTHRLLSKDVGFKNLGLLIIDEEQRFGVAHKERLKQMRINVDILTMTATPIPRTLHMALLGLRDISSLATPPLDRRSIVTSVTRYDKELIRRGIYRELNRQGQVFFVHNRVQSINRKAQEIQELAKDAKIAIAHGQMPKTQLEKAMIDFVTGQTDVLVCTTIIESGLDIPNANTMFINDADRFGLAEMHQLRGRVGRYKHRAYAYMLLPLTRSITPIAAKRLKAIEEYSHLGAGFRIALRDLEIRGAGNILGSEQSGHIQMVGYQMYCDLLADAVKRQKGKPVPPSTIAAIDLGFTTYIPKNYIPLDRHRMDVYRKIAVAKTPEDLEQIQNELADIYGPTPEEVKLLLDVADLRIKAAKQNIKSITASGTDLIFTFTKEHTGQIEKLFADTSANLNIPNPKTAYLRLQKNYFEPQTLITILRKILGDR